MYVSVRDVSIIHAGYPTLLDGLRALGISSVELVFDREFSVQAINPIGGKDKFCLRCDGDRLLLKDQLNEYGVKVSAILLANNFNAPDIDAEIDWAVCAIEAAGSLGIEAVRIDSAMRGERELPFEERTRKFIDCTKKVISSTEASGIDLGIENHGSQGNDPNFLDAIIKEVGSPRLGLTMDTGNLYWSGKPLSEVYEILRHFAPLTKHTHVKNIRYPGDVREKMRELGWEYSKYVSPIYEGDIDHSRLISFLKEVGYTRDMTIEDESLGKFSVEEKKEILKKDADYLKGII